MRLHNLDRARVEAAVRAVTDPAVRSQLQMHTPSEREAPADAAERSEPAAVGDVVLVPHPGAETAPEVPAADESMAADPSGSASSSLDGGRGVSSVEGSAAGAGSAATAGSKGVPSSFDGRGDVSSVEGSAVSAGSAAAATSSGQAGGEASALAGVASVAERFARAAWSCLVEPGDVVAGLLVGEFGADRALSMLLERMPPDAWSAALPPDIRAELSTAEIATALERWRPRLSSTIVLNALTAAAHCGALLVVPGDRGWPAGLDDLGPHAPLALWVRGDLAHLVDPSGAIALVGSRDATSYGDHMAMDLAAGLSDRGFSIVSGAAYGIDGMAHRAALASGSGTIAYLAGGVDRLYPSGHSDLLRRIIASGAVVSELPCGAAPTRWRFLQRNRLIAATAGATVVVEAGHRSGSLNTAGHAAALGRPLGAVPGPVTSVNSAGCHRLLREYDAVCVTSAEEVAELVRGRPTPQPTLLDGVDGGAVESAGVADASGRTSAPIADTAVASSAGADAQARGGAARGRDSGRAGRVLDALSRRAGRSVDDLARRSGLSPKEVQAVLGALAIEGAAREALSGWLRS
ncbi:DNA-processing protein DprA [Herbiconiux liukaitaii]|uniref:DNA-processing protein DprA n=1 Tax=Herbiconiux liukaitaii TaxID=3342799 RepID=UPI0035B6D258